MLQKSFCIIFITLIQISIIKTRENIAYKKTVTATSIESSEYKAEFAVDADGNTRWSSQSYNNQNFIVDLWKIYTIGSVVISWEAAYASQFQIQVSLDNVSWKTVYENYNAKGGKMIITFPPIQAHYVKIFLIKRATIYGFSIIEFEIYESDKSDAAIKKRKVLNYLYNTKGKSTIIGIHNREPNREPTKQTDKIHEITGKYPALWSGDFLFSNDDVNNRQKMINECINQWNSGSIVHLMLHVVSPTQSEPGQWDGGVVKKLSDTEWSSLITNGGDLNIKWKKRLDIYASFIQQLKNAGVPVLFRPFHEMNQRQFWWAGRKGKNGTGALYRLTRDYLEKEKGLDNIIWIWDMQDLSYDWEEYNPGNDYWEIFAVDVYNGDYYTSYKYNLASKIGRDKLIAIGECDKLPTSKEIYAQKEWSFIMSWAELTFEKNTETEIQHLYWADNIIIREELPDFNVK